MSAIKVPVLRLPGAEDLPLPAYATPGSAGLDLLAAVDEPMELTPLETALVPTGLCLALPEGYEGQVRPRSGLAARYGVTVLNSPGTIDADYRGEIKVILVNLGKAPFRIERGTRIAQLVVAPVARIEWSPAPALPESARGGGGFGHTGT
ncbi:MAG: dUTP diphosphatase [Firmicutes bacterium]|nr:dUTP diphosphatase [Bacillota bacterium]